MRCFLLKSDLGFWTYGFVSVFSLGDSRLGFRHQTPRLRYFLRFENFIRFKLQFWIKIRSFLWQLHRFWISYGLLSVLGPSFPELLFLKILWLLFMDGVQLPQGLSYFEEALKFLLLSSQKYLVLILSTSEGWKADSTLERPSGFKHGTPGLGTQCLDH